MKRKFQEIAQMPNVIGCVDGTLIRIRKPDENPYEYIGRKHFAAINAMVCCGADNLIYNANAKWPGSTHDAKVFKQSSLAKIMERGT